MEPINSSAPGGADIRDASRSGTVALAVAILFVLAGSATAQPQTGWLPFDVTVQARGLVRSAMKDETTSGMLVNFDVPGMQVHEVKGPDGVIYHRLMIPGKGTLMDVGKPELPLLGEVVEVPHGIDFTAEIVKSKSRVLKDFVVYPVPEPQVDGVPMEQGGFRKDSVAYRLNAFFPAAPTVVSPSDIAIVRGHRLLFLKVFPVQYNPVTKELRVYSNIEVRLHFSKPSQVDRIDKRLVSRPFEDFLAAGVLNYKKLERFDWYDHRGQPKPTTPKWPRDPGVLLPVDAPGGTTGCDYLIISTDDLYKPNDPTNPIVRLRDWKQRKGLVTQVVTLSGITDSDGNGTIDTVDIKAYISNAYSTWVPPPSYVLLVGDVGNNAGTTIIPTIYRTPHPGGNNPDGHYATLVPTDLYYFTVDGADYFPDIFYGRISVDDVNQAADVITKIISYERTPPPHADADFYTHTSLVSYFQDDDFNGRENRSFIEFIDEIRTYLTGIQVDVQRIYVGTPGAANPASYQDGTALPNDLLVANGFQWNGNATAISDAINSGPGNRGRSLVIFRDHGSRDRWSHPVFDVNDVNALRNQALLPVVLSVACQTGWFDNETDDDAGLTDQSTNANSESFCEMFLRNWNGGAVAVVGATRNSLPGYNDFMMYGMVKAIWPDFAPAPPLGNSYPAIPTGVSGPIPRMGQICNFGKMFMANAYSHDLNRLLQFELYHVFGDPETAFWSREPAALIVEHPLGIGSTGEQDFVVKVKDAGGTAIAGAVVSLTQNGAIVNSRSTDPGGVARFTGKFAVGQIDITVTGLNLRPYLGIIPVTADGATVNRLNPDNGAEGQPFNVGGVNFTGSEQVEIRLGTQVMQSVQATSGAFGQSGVGDVSITVPSGHAHGLFNLGVRGMTSGKWAAEVFQVRDPNPVDLYTYSQWNSSTWYLNQGENPIWDNPEIQLYDAGNVPVGSDNLVVGHQYVIRARVHNGTAFAAANVAVTFKWANLGLGQGVWNSIGIAHVDVSPYGIQEAEIQWTPSLTGHTCVQAEIYHLEDIDATNNTGQENCWVGPTSSPAVVPLEVRNPGNVPALLYFELRQLYQRDLRRSGPFWGTTIVHPDPQVLPPGGTGKAEVVLDPDWTYIEPGQVAEFALTGFVGGKMVGGVNMSVSRRLYRWGASAHLGLAIPSGVFGEYFDPGFAFFGDLVCNLTPRISAVVLVGQSMFSRGSNAPPGLDDTYWRNVSVNVQYRQPVRGPLSVYGRGGAGKYYPKSGSSKTGFDAGAGLMYHLNNRVALAGGVDYHTITKGMDVYSLGPATVGANVRFTLVHVGVLYSF